MFVEQGTNSKRGQSTTKYSSSFSSSYSSVFLLVGSCKLELLQAILAIAVQLSAPVFLATCLQTILSFYNTF